MSDSPFDGQGDHMLHVEVLITHMTGRLQVEGKKDGKNKHQVQFKKIQTLFFLVFFFRVSFQLLSPRCGSPKPLDLPFGRLQRIDEELPVVDQLVVLGRIGGAHGFRIHLLMV